MVQRGSEFRKWDLHIHSPYTVLNNQFDKLSDGSPDVEKFIQKIRDEGISAVGLTNYFNFNDDDFKLKERLNKEGNRDKFRKLYHESKNIHGKIYALVWFFDNDKNLYRRYKNELNQNEHVMIHHADVKLISPLSDVFPLIESGYLKKHILY